MFENIFNTIMDTKVKTKDNIKARMDITLFYERKYLILFIVLPRVRDDIGRTRTPGRGR